MRVSPAQISGFVGATYPAFLVSRRGDLVVLTTLSNNTNVLLLYTPGSTEPRVLQFRGFYGVFAMRGEDVLWHGDSGRGIALQAWKPDGTHDQLLARNSALDGETITEMDGAAWVPDGALVALVRTQTRPFVIAKAGEIVAQAGDTVRTAAAVSFTSLVAGAKSPGSAYLIGGGDPSNVLELKAARSAADLIWRTFRGQRWFRIASSATAFVPRPMARCTYSSHHSVSRFRTMVSTGGAMGNWSRPPG